MTGPSRTTAQRGRRLLFPLVGALLALVVASSVNAATGWTGPGLVSPKDNCADVDAAIDSSGTYHVVADCGGRIRYTTDESGEWATTYFSVPVDFADQRPHVSIDGNQVYVGYTRVMFLACGIDYVGAYFRSRTLDSATWTPAKRIGFEGDNLQSFQVVKGVISLTVFGTQAFYETWTPTLLQRYLLTDAVGASSVRIGSDGKPRIVYEAASGLRYGVFNGSGFTQTTIPGTTTNDRSPSLVLDANNRAHVTWTHIGPPSCSDMPADPANGTYYATNRTGSWTSPSTRRVTDVTGSPSLAVDVATGRVHLLLGGESGLSYYTKTSGGTWSAQKLSSSKIASTSLSFDQAHGTLLAVYAREPDTGVSSSIFSFTKP